MARPPIDISALSVAERLELIEQLWDSLGEFAEVTDAQRLELRERLAAVERGEMRSIPLVEALAAIREGRPSR